MRPKGKDEMSRSTKCTYSLIKGLYGELERARREYEADASSEGGTAYGLWLELLEIADWHFEGAPGIEGDPADVEGSTDAESMGGTPPAIGEQLLVPGVRELDAPVPRGTLGKPSERVALVGAAGLSDAAILTEAAARGLLKTGKAVRRGSSTPIE